METYMETVADMDYEKMVEEKIDRNESLVDITEPSQWVYKGYILRKICISSDRGEYEYQILDNQGSGIEGELGSLEEAIDRVDEIVKEGLK